MKFLAVCFFAVVAVAAAKPGLVAPLAAAPLAYTAPAVVGSAAYLMERTSAVDFSQQVVFWTRASECCWYRSHSRVAAYTAPVAAAYAAPIAAPYTRLATPYAAAYTSPLAYSSPYVATAAAPLLLKK
ncbi:uncharacterized protein Dsimw501_GD14062 [Drosophila simulans]|uniref:Uncharacterized protein n=1 Tax=Drosophila simulans TaxID=7240 RepID=A0A0J9RRH6_DROSI|nr:uncharacterized protein Dsimw501_GD14062 [Drosophila simulans]